MMTPTSGDVEELATREGVWVECEDAGARKIAADMLVATGAHHAVASESITGEIAAVAMCARPAPGRIGIR